MSEKHVMMNRKKVKCTTPVRNLMKEYFRDEETSLKYDDGVRNIDTNQTKHNVTLQAPPDNYDTVRKERLALLTERRKSNGQRGMRKDTVDLMTTVVQAGEDFINKMEREEQVKFFQDTLDVMKEDPETYGEVDGAVIHFDETTPHMQVISSTLDYERNKSRAKEMFGNKTKMSMDQTKFVEAVQNKGYDVERGVNRVDNNYKARKEALENKYKVDINRENEGFINGLETREKNVKRDEKNAKQMLVDGLARDYPYKRAKNERTGKQTPLFKEKDGQTELMATASVGSLLRLRGVYDRQHAKMLERKEEKLKERERRAREKERKRERELKQREEELDAKEQGLNERARNISETVKGIGEFVAFYDSVKSVFGEVGTGSQRDNRKVVAMVKQKGDYDYYLNEVKKVLEKPKEISSEYKKPHSKPKPSPTPRKREKEGFELE